MTETKETDIHPTAADATTAEAKWHTVQNALCERIRRYAAALARLSPDNGTASFIDERLASVANDPEGLLDLLERTEQQLDRAFTTRAGRAAPVPTMTTGKRARHDPVDFKAD